MASVATRPPQPESGRADSLTPGGQAAVTPYAGVAPLVVEAERLRAAEARLARLPTSVRPQTGHLASGSRLPFPRNPLFTGRDADLRALAQQLAAGPDANGQAAAAVGPGGIGKSQLALEFALRYGQFFAGGVFWLDLSTASNVPAEICQCQGAVEPEHQADFGRLPQGVQLKLILAAWQSPLPRLLIFDNCLSDHLLETWRPPVGGCRILITSRHLVWPLAVGVQSQVLGVLPRADSLALLRKFRPDLPPTDPGLNALAGEAGDHPLALYLAGRYLEHYRDVALGQPTAYLTTLRQALRQDGNRSVGAGHEPKIAAAFRINSDVLDPIHPVDALASQALAQAACLAPDVPIPRAVLPLARQIDPQSDAARLFEEALRRLARLGLIEEGAQGTLWLPRVLARLVLAQIAGSTVPEQVELALLSEAERLNAAGQAAALQSWQVHLAWVARSAERRRSPLAARLYNELGYHARLRGALAQARIYHERSLSLGQATLGRDHPDLVTWHNNLGRVLKLLGDLPGARQNLERALAIGQQAFGPESEDVATLHNNLGLLLHDQGDLANALPHFEQAVAIGARTLGPDHPAMAIRHSNLGRLWFNLRGLANARAHFERALAIGEQALGADHPDLAARHDSLGQALHALGDLDGARTHFERALALGAPALGPVHPEVMTWQSHLGRVRREFVSWHDNEGRRAYDQGDLADARGHFEKALALGAQTLGPEHPDVATLHNNLGRVLHNLGDTTTARFHIERALAIGEQSLGPDHPAIAYRHSNLGRVLHDLGDMGSAQLHYERALRIGAAALGPNHPDMATWHNNLGRVLHDLGDLTVARIHFERALAIARQTLGPDHPDVTTLHKNLEPLMTADNGAAKPPPRILDRLTRFIRPPRR